MTRKASPAQARAAAIAIVRKLRQAGHTAYFAGGCVRDELLGLSPTDYDIATDAQPEAIRALFKRTAEVGAAFGVVLVTPQEDEGVPERATVEVATFRSDGPYTDKRRPDHVEFGTPEQDARRRDFTVNALFLDPEEETERRRDEETKAGTAGTPKGRVIDLVGGLPDLDKKLIRAVGDPEARLAEDHLRALRAVRFAARLGFSIDSATAAAIRAHTRDLLGVSRERIGDEMRRMLGHASRAAAVGMLEELALDAPVLEEAHKKSSLAILRGLTGWGQSAIPFATSLAAWALDRGLTVTGPGALARAISLVGRWRPALCLSNAEKGQLAGIFEALVALAGEWDQAPIARQKRLAGAAEGGFGEALRLLEMTDPARAAAVRARVSDLAKTPGGLAPEPFMTGDDLVAAGFKPGRAFKRLLDRVYDAQLEGRIQDKSHAIRMAAELEGKPGV